MSGKLPTRALLVLRLSRVTEESTSIERQRQDCERLCESRGYAVVGVAEDSDVSAGKTTPFQRPALGAWLQRPEEFDVLVFFRADRLVRSARHLSELMAWAEDHGISLVSATENHFDTTAHSGAMGRLFASLTAMFAEMELEGIRERTQSSWKHLHSQGKSTGSVPIFGYESYRDADGVAKLRLEPNDSALLREAYTRVMAGEGLPAIAHSFTSRGELTPRDRNHVRQGRAPKGSEWSTSSLKRILQSQGLQGYAVYRERKLDGNGNPVRKNGSAVYGEEQVRRNPDGSPMVRAEPVFSPVEFSKLQDELQRRAATKTYESPKSETLLLHVLYCGVCGKPMYRLKGSEGRADRYRCKSYSNAAKGRRDNCGNGTIQLPKADEAVSTMLLDTFGSSERQIRTWDPGEDSSAELEEVNLALEDLTNLVASPAYRAGTPQRERLDSRITELAQRQEELEANPVRPAGWSYQGSGELFSDWWQRLGVVEQNRFLRETGVRATGISPKGRGDAKIHAEFGDIPSMVKDLTVSAETSEYIEGGRPLGSLHHDEQVTVFRPEVSGPYDEYRAQGYTVFAELGASGEILAAKDAEAMGRGEFTTIRNEDK